MNKLIISRKTQREEFLKVNSFPKEVENAWFEAYFSDAIKELSCLYPTYEIEIIDDNIESIEGIKHTLQL